MVDGIFGSRTATAVRAFQQTNGLLVDGIVGQQTWRRLLEVTAPASQ
jgi:N-acetylmuramoyl-L-alanine amidase